MLRFQYQTIEFGKTDIHLRTLRDNFQYEDINDVAQKLGISSATWPIFGVVWASSEILARIMHTHDIKGKRILEVGCGIGLASLVLKKRLADITATDYHPEVENYLLINMLAQSAALMNGSYKGDVRNHCPGNRPSTVFLLKEISASSLGQLMAVSYTHLTLPTNREV